MTRFTAVFVCTLLAGCSGPTATAPDAPSATVPAPSDAANGDDDHAALPRKLPAQHLLNAWRIHEKVISGGQPEGDAAFAELAAMGVRTIISVDGARPDVAAARRHQMRYVHLPHGYDGVPQQRAQELAKAVRDLPGPIYIHCHHGKHRSPAASAVACVSAGLLEPRSAVVVLQAAGTSDSYQGLFESAREARRLDDRLLDELPADFPETAKLPPLAEAMVALERTHDHLKQIETAGWKSPAGHPDLDPAHEVLLLREHFTELLRTDDVRLQPAEFERILKDSRQAALALESALRRPAADVDQAAAALARISADCADCHRQFRDVPLSAKQPTSR